MLLRGSIAAGSVGMARNLGLGPAAASPNEIRRHPDAVTVALIGDFGNASRNEQAVATLVHSWNPAAVFTMGDNVYSGAGADPHDVLEWKVVSYYRRFVDSGSFFPSLGNHDWGDPGTPLLWADGKGGTTGAWHDVFDLPGNGRYYDVRLGPLHAFVLDDYYLEPDGHLVGSEQTRWLQRTAAASDAPFKFVVHHYAPYVSSPGGGHAGIRWPFGDWGIDASFSGHWHRYERWHVNGVHYIINGLGGAPIGWVGARHPESLALYNDSHGASRLTVAPTGALIDFVAVDGTVIDSLQLSQSSRPGEYVSVPPDPEPPRNDVRGTVSSLQLNDQYLIASGREAVIVRLYGAVFGRGPDQAGFRYWTGLSVPTAEIANHFVGSPEFAVRYGRLTDEQFVERVYQNVLGRPSDRAGMRYWSGLLQSGVDRGTVMLGFSESPEFRLRSGVRG